MVKSITKWALTSLIVLFFVPLVYLAVYFFAEVSPRIPEINEMLQAAQVDTPSFKLASEMTKKVERRERVGSYVAQVLAFKSYHSDGLHKIWQLHYLSWYAWVSLYFTEQEQFRLWLAIAPYEKG